MYNHRRIKRDAISCEADVTRASSVTSGACLCILFAVQEHPIRRTKIEQLCELGVDSNCANHDRAIKAKRAKKEAL